MLFTTTTQYTLKILFYLQEHKDILVSAKTLAEALDIPYKYLTKILTNLTKRHFVESIQGRYGGYRIKEDAALRIEDIASLEKERLKECVLGHGLCKENQKCRLHDSWKKPKKAILESLLKEKI